MTTPLVEERGKPETNGRGTLAIPHFNVPPLRADRQRHYTPWLVIRYDAGDYGGRPLPAGTVFWESPDVWVTSTLGVNQPAVGQPNSVFARVSNFGLQQANGVVVKFWWADPSIAITESSAHLIGTGFAVVPAKRSVVVECPRPWIPIEENGGHECLLAEAYVPGFDPLADPMDPVLDRHVGQKNETLVVVEPGGEFHLTLHTANIAPLRQVVAIDVDAVTARTLPQLFQRRNELREAALSPPASHLPLTIRAHGPSGRFVAPSEAFARSLLTAMRAQIAGRTVRTRASWISRSVELEPWEATRVEISGGVPHDAAIGQTFMFRVVQRIGPVVTGGYTIGVLVA
jgi:hypothetical protein